MDSKGSGQLLIRKQPMIPPGQPGWKHLPSRPMEAISLFTQRIVKPQDFTYFFPLRRDIHWVFTASNITASSSHRASCLPAHCSIAAHTAPTLGCAKSKYWRRLCVFEEGYCWGKQHNVGMVCNMLKMFAIGLTVILVGQGSKIISGQLLNLLVL